MRTRAVVTALALVGLLGAAAAAPRDERPADLDDAFERARLEQSLVLAERTAVELGELRAETGGDAPVGGP